MKWNKKTKEWTDDEWLTQIYGNLQEAKDAVIAFSEGRSFDNNRELQVTRYFGASKDPFNRGQELPKGDPRVVLHEWMRYAVYIISD